MEEKKNNGVIHPGLLIGGSILGGVALALLGGFSGSFGKGGKLGRTPKDGWMFRERPIVIVDNLPV
jgi:hypothetical protein